MSAHQLTTTAAAECNAIRARNAASIAAMPLRVIAYSPTTVSASEIVNHARLALGDELSAAELLAHDDLDAILGDALSRACSELGTTAAGLELAAR